jgi:hypothetical protein
MNVTFDIPALDHIATFLAQLVEIQSKRLTLPKSKMPNIDLAVLKQILDLANTALLTETSQAATITARDTTIATLQAEVGPLPPDVQASVDSFLANAAAANPPANPVPVPPPADPTAPVTPVTPPPTGLNAPDAPAAPAAPFDPTSATS